MDAFGALADPVRRQLLSRLAERPCRVVDLAADQAISRPAVSKHLRILVQAGLAEARTAGRERHYRLLASGLQPVREHLERWAPAEAAAASDESGSRVPPHAIDALELEVRRVGRERRQGLGATPLSGRGQRLPATQNEETG